jgi:hypothetical protein
MMFTPVFMLPLGDFIPPISIYEIVLMNTITYAVVGFFLAIGIIWLRWLKWGVIATLVLYWLFCISLSLIH